MTHLCWYITYQTSGCHLWQTCACVFIQTDSQRFSHPECEEKRSWKEIARTYKDMQHMFETGSLGTFATKDLRVWGCFFDHTCLKMLSTPATEAICYKFNEEKQTWHPWALKSEIHQCTWCSWGVLNMEHPNHLCYSKSDFTCVLGHCFQGKDHQRWPTLYQKIMLLLVYVLVWMEILVCWL
jgi:hypothetical protein